MKSDRTPETSGPPQKQAEEKPEQPSSNCARCCLGRVKVVTETE
jgi:hypothetical protein